MPQNISKEQVNYGDIIYQWDVLEYERNPKNRRWYLVMGSLAAILIIYAIYIAAVGLVIVGMRGFMDLVHKLLSE